MNFQIIQIEDNDFIIVHLIINIVFTIIFLIGLILAIKRYKKRRTVNRLVLMFLMLQGFLFGFGSYIFFFTDWLRIFPILGSFSMFFFITSLIILNIKLERKVEEVSKEVETSEERYRNLVLSIVDVIFELDSKLIITFVSPQIKELFEFKPYEVINQNIKNFIHPDDIQKVESMFNELFKTKTYIELNCRIRKKSRVFLDISIIARYVIHDQKVKIVGVIRDISKEIKAKTILESQYEKLKEIDQMRSDLLRLTSHELKTPLISLFSATEYLLDSYKEDLNEDVLKFIKIINRGGKRLKQLISNLLDAYNIESQGELKLNKEKFDLVKSIKECANDLIFLLEERDLYLKEELYDRFIINADKIRIEQVILNILSNAIKNTPSKGLILIKLMANEKFVDIIIKDTGIGLTEKEKQQLFKKFVKIERINVINQIDTEGSGLGLYISKKIVEAHGGKILVESEGRNKGSTFIVRLPII
ncbi:MAG: PAS domain-containing sensor histidine kinase [Promethearchaeota archaeon]